MTHATFGEVLLLANCTARTTRNSRGQHDRKQQPPEDLIAHGLLDETSRKIDSRRKGSKAHQLLHEFRPARTGACGPGSERAGTRYGNAIPAPTVIISDIPRRRLRTAHTISPGTSQTHGVERTAVRTRREIAGVRVMPRRDVVNQGGKTLAPNAGCQHEATRQETPGNGVGEQLAPGDHQPRRKPSARTAISPD